MRAEEWSGGGGYRFFSMFFIPFVFVIGRAGASQIRHVILLLSVG
jgi:hypothetical protein